MTEQNDDFFEGKRPWSVIKDEILGAYMSPYIAKVNRLKRRILLIDGYAGPGVFDDGSAGSPLIICQAAERFAKGNYQQQEELPREVGKRPSQRGMARCSDTNPW